MKPFLFNRYVIKEHIGPFIFAVSIIVFLFFINFTLREAGKLFGRGLSAWIILQMFYYHLAPILSMAIPMSVMIATLMAFIRMAADSEITILRSSGIPLLKILKPLLLIAMLICAFMFYFMNTVLPAYNIESSKLAREISRLKPTATIFPNTFTSLKHVKLYVDSLDDNFNDRVDEKISRLGKDYASIPVDHLFDVVIYDTKNPKRSVTIVAKEGFVLLNEQKQVYEFILFEGNTQEIDHDKKDEYKYTTFDKSTFYITASEFIEKETSQEVNWKSSRQQNVTELQENIEKEKTRISKRIKNRLKQAREETLKVDGLFPPNMSKMVAFLPIEADSVLNDSVKAVQDSLQIAQLDSLKKEDFKVRVYEKYARLILDESNQMRSTIRQNTYSQENIWNYEGEWHKKFSIPFASIIFVLIGAPLGMMTRKGEAGSAITICLIIFLVNHTCLILGEKMSEAGKIAPWFGLWSGHMINSLFACVLLYRLSQEKTMSVNIFKLFSRKGT